MRIIDWSSDVCSSDLIDVHGSEPFVGRPLAGELHNCDLEPEPSLVKIENLLHLQRPREKAATGNQGEQAFRDKPVHRLAQRRAADFQFAGQLALVEPLPRLEAITQDRKSVVSGKSVSVRVDLGGRRIIKKTKTSTQTYKQIRES